MQDPPPLPDRPPAPVPVQTLDYSDPPRQGRPGLVTAIGVMSIVVASLSVLFSLQTGAQAVGFFFMSRMAASMPATTTTSSTIATSYSSSTGATSVSVAPATAPATTPPTALTPSEIQQVISKVQSNLGGKKLNAAQVAALQAALQSPSQGLVTPGTAWSPVTSTSIDSSGTADLDLSGGSIEIDAKGLVVSQSSTSTGAFTMPQVGLGPCILGLFDGVASLGLAVWLLVAGIAALRNSRRALRMHTIYGWAKIPMSILGGIAYSWLMTEMMGSMPGARAAGANRFFAWYAGFFAALGCAYPIGLLIALRARSVRAYYHAIVE